MPKTKISKELKELLNRAIAREPKVSVQYMWQHVMWKGISAYSVRDEFMKIAIASLSQEGGDNAGIIIKK